MVTTATDKLFLKGMSMPELEAWAVAVGEPKFRGMQLFEWMYNQGVDDPDAMENLPKSLRQRMTDEVVLSTAKIISEVPSDSGATVKYLIEFRDGRQVETVSMIDGKRHTLCVSSQVGCNVGCDFCATAKMGLLRNLEAGEIVDQYLLARKARDLDITNIVFMGMGEPMLNYEKVLQAADIFHHQKGMGIGAGKITISTAGVAPKVARFGEENRPYRLAVSLNAPNDEIRSSIMPINNTWPIDELLKASMLYANKPKRTVTFEYVLLEGINDSLSHARELIRLVNHINCKVNVIPYNETDGAYKRPTEDVIDDFFREIAGGKFPVMIRWSRGSNIAAGCGQLAVQAA